MVRVEESAILRTGWHRLLFPSSMKRWAVGKLREYGRAAGQQELAIARDTSPSLAFSTIVDGKGATASSDAFHGARSQEPMEADSTTDLDVGEKNPEVRSTDVSGLTTGRASDSFPRDVPGPGENVFVEELPEAIVKVPPIYPELARQSRVEGTVLVQALVGKDGRVKATRVAQSVPMLDEAAVSSVRRWVFRPAHTKKMPVAVWVTVPIRFTLQ